MSLCHGKVITKESCNWVCTMPISQHSNIFMILLIFFSNRTSQPCFAVLRATVIIILYRFWMNWMNEWIYDTTRQSDNATATITSIAFHNFTIRQFCCPKHDYFGTCWVFVIVSKILWNMFFCDSPYILSYKSNNICCCCQQIHFSCELGT